MNLFELAARLGQTATPDPIISQLLADIRTATGREGSVRDQTDPLFQEYSFQNKTQAMNRYPTVRVDYQLTDRHRLTYSMNFQYIGGGQTRRTVAIRTSRGSRWPPTRRSERRAASAWLRSMIGTNMVNEFRFGYGGAPVIFWQEQMTPELFSGTVANQGGYYLNLNNPTFITPAEQSGDAVGARCLQPVVREHPELAEGLAQLQLRRVRVELPGVDRRSADRAGAALRRRAGRSGRGDVRGRELPGRIDGGADQRAPALCGPHRTRQRGSRHCALERGQRLRISRAGHAARSPARVRVLGAGFLAPPARPVAEPRSSLRTADAVRGAEQQLFDRRISATSSAYRAPTTSSSLAR